LTLALLILLLNDHNISAPFQNQCCLLRNEKEKYYI
jgi:hypothetical protein